jgi:T-complex protein 1 subunit theta
LQLIKGIAEAGAKVVVSGGTVGDIAMHFLEKYKLMVVKSQSKVELKRLCKALGATALVRLVSIAFHQQLIISFTFLSI